MRRGGHEVTVAAPTNVINLGLPLAHRLREYPMTLSSFRQRKIQIGTVMGAMWRARDVPERATHRRQTMPLT